MILTEIKFPYSQRLQEALCLWDKWEYQLLLLLSLTLQFILLIFGNRRVFTGVHTPRIAIMVWLTYVSADWVAAYTLSSLLRIQEKKQSGFYLFWTPFILLHLGFPDTISAYSQEDNELWLRHFLTFCIQVGQALYIFWRYQAATSTSLKLLALPIFVAGVIKYGERIYALRSASSQTIKNSVFSASKSQPANGLRSQEEPLDLQTYIIRRGTNPEATLLHEAHLSFRMCSLLFSNYTIRLYKELHEIVKMGHTSAAEAFKMVETELGFWYDSLYTKRTILNYHAGIALWWICFLSSFCSLFAFPFIVDQLSSNEASKANIVVSYLLLAGAAFLDIYAAIAHIFSEWTLCWLTRRKIWLGNFIYQAAVRLHLFRANGTEGLITIGQYNLLSYSLENKTSMYERIERFFDTENMLRKYLYTKWETVTSDLQNMIYSHLQRKCKEYEDKDFDYKFLTELLARRGDGVLQLKGILEDFEWSLTEVEFNHSLFLWHIATDLCHYDDINKYHSTEIPCLYHKMSKYLSDYMLYLLVLRPRMVPDAISEIRYRMTREEAMKFFNNIPETDISNAANALLQWPGETWLLGPDPEQGQKKSVLFDGADLAQQLQELVTEERWDNEEKWKMISEVWIEMLLYAASHCEWKEHARELRRSRELLTHVALLMAHLGLSRKIHIVPLPEELQYSGYRPRWRWDSFHDLTQYLV